MPLVNVDRIDVNFPFEPYDCQLTYMEKVVKCLKEEWNGILESPTGTGKTLCLLCSSLAWLESKKAQISSHKWEMTAGEDVNNLEANKRQMTATLDDCVGRWRGEIAPPRIIYASRTHSQLTQAIGELKRTAYRHVKVCVIGSREQLCIHPQVSKEENNATKVHLCRAKVSARSCQFYNNVDEKRHHFGTEVMDIEDLVNLGNKHKCCPYYTAREMKSEADIIFLPYNYLVDPKSRRAHGIELNNNIVIFDEAHNLEKICEDSVSFDWTSAEMAAAIRDLEEVTDKLTELVAHEETNTAAFDLDAETRAGPDFTLEQVLMLKGILHNIERVVDEVPINRTEGISKPGGFLYELFGKAELNFSNKDEVVDYLDKLTQYLTNDAGSSLFSRKGTGLSKFADVVKIAFSRDPTNEYTPMSNHQGRISRHYKVYLKEQKKETGRKKGGWDAEPASSKTGRVLSYWCFSPGAAMEELKAQGVKCIILTSGTLSPMSSFKTEMGLDFRVELENSHVIEKQQVWIGVVGRGPDGTMLSSAYDNRSKPEYLDSLGNAMVNFARIVPHGLLLFFPSYTVMDKCLERWTGQNIWYRVEQYKPIFIEPKRKQDFLTAMDNFYEKVRDPQANGAVFAAVCRGKVSEGLDFSDINGRAVVILGLPYPPRMDPKVLLKMEHLDETRKKGGNGLWGREWYKQQASRAVNQAIGRVIRHKNDYGAIILCDNRFSAADCVAQLPSWVRPCLKTYTAFGAAVRDVMGFFKHAEQMLPAALPPKQRIRAGDPGCVGAYFEPSVRSRARPDATDLQKSGSVASHVPSLRQQPADSGTSFAKLTLQYEGASSAQSHAAAPPTLLAALDTKKPEPFSFSAATSPEGYMQQTTQKTHSVKPRKKIVLQRSGSRDDGMKNKLQSAEQYLAEVRKTLSTESYKLFTQSLSGYKKTSDFDRMVTCLADIFTDNQANYHFFRKFYKFVRPQHKQKFDEMCRNLTGEGCGYTPSDSAVKRKSTEPGNMDHQRKKHKDEGLFKKPLNTKETKKCSSVLQGSANLDSKTHLNTNAMSSSLPSTSTSNQPTKRINKPASSIATHTPTASSRDGTSSRDQSLSRGETPQLINSNESKSSSSDKIEQNKVKSKVLTEKTNENPADCEHNSTEYSEKCAIQLKPKLKEGSHSADSESEPQATARVSAQWVPQTDEACTCGEDGPQSSGKCSAHPAQTEGQGVSISEALQNTIDFVMDQKPSGVDCMACGKDARVPLKALCGHVCCMQCWKDAITETKQCPQCKSRVKRKHLRRLFFSQAQLEQHS